MVVLALTLLVAAVATFSLGVLLWVICIQFWTEHIPEGITHPVRLRILSCLLHLTMTWVSLCFVASFARGLRTEVRKKQILDASILLTIQSM